MRILMVCLGNICRSPLAQGILEKKCRERKLDWEIDSAGTGAWHVGEGPDTRSIAIAQQNGIDITRQRSRQVQFDDFDRFELILAMDTSNYVNLKDFFGHKFDPDKIKLILNFVYPGSNMAVPDPYYDGGFENVYHLLNLACDNLIEQYSN